MYFATMLFLYFVYAMNALYYVATYMMIRDLVVMGYVVYENYKNQNESQKKYIQKEKISVIRRIAGEEVK